MSFDIVAFLKSLPVRLQAKIRYEAWAEWEIASLANSSPDASTFAHAAASAGDDKSIPRKRPSKRLDKTGSQVAGRE